MTKLLTKREVLPDNIVSSALTTEASLEYPHAMRFEIVKSNSEFSPMLDNILQDNGVTWTSAKPQDTNITFKVSGYEPVEFVLRAITIRCNNTTNSGGFRGMVFTGPTDPDFESFDWCKHFNQQQFDQFEKRRKGPRRPHEPVSFFKTEASSCHIKMNPPGFCHFFF